MAGPRHIFGKFDLAFAEYARLLELQPDFQPALYMLSLGYLQTKQFDKAAVMFERWARLENWPRADRVRELVLRIGTGRPTADLLRELRPVLRDNVGFAGTAALHLHAGDRNGALDLLEEAVNAHDWFMFPIGAEPLFAPLRGDPRFDALLRRMNLDPATLPR